MPPASLDEIAAAVGGRWSQAGILPLWSGRVRIDSRQIELGDAFLALPGNQHDGHDFVAAALNRGAALAIVRADREVPDAGPQLLVPDPAIALQDLARWHRRQIDALVIGVTGSVGKTTTRELIHTLLSGRYAGTRSRNNFNNELGLPLSLLDIQPDHEFAVLELGASRIGDIARLAEIALPEVGVVTAIGSAHLATFGSIAGVIQAKGELFESLPAGGFAVLPGDCPKLRSLVPRARCRVISVGEHADNRFCISGIQQTTDGVAFRFDGRDYRLASFGRHNVANAACALAIGREVGISAAELADRLAEFVPIAGRCRVIRIGPWTVIDDSYNASPAAFSAALTMLSEFPAGLGARRLVVAGDMLELGAAASTEHHRLGEQIARHGVDRLLVTGSHADDVADGAIRAGLPNHRIAATNNWDALLLLLDCWLEPGDVILVKGSRGMKMERILAWMESAAAEQQWEPRKCA